MVLYVFQYYEDGKPVDILSTSSITQVKNWFESCVFDNKFSEDFDLVGYEIPSDVVKKYKKDAELIHDEYIMNADPADLADTIVLYQNWTKKQDKPESAV